jgi:hypothetical protein
MAPTPYPLPPIFLYMDQGPLFYIIPGPGRAPKLSIVRVPPISN